MSRLFTRLTSIAGNTGLTFPRKIIIPVEIDSMMPRSYHKLSTNLSNCPPTSTAMASKGCSACLRALRRPLQAVRPLPPSQRQLTTPDSSPELPPITASPANHPQQPAWAAQRPQPRPPHIPTPAPRSLARSTATWCCPAAWRRS